MSWLDPIPYPHNPYVQQQIEAAKHGQAIGQCAECGTYRLDGLPPVLHQHGCSHTDDWRTDPLWSGLAGPVLP